MKIAINGFGRIGRNVFKIAYERPGIDIAAVNDTMDMDILGYLLKHDSVYGLYKRKVDVREDSFFVDDREIRFFSERNPADLPWREMGIDVVIECTGAFPTAVGENGGYKDHIRAGARKVVLAALAEDVDRTIVLGVNDDDIDSEADTYSCACSTSNCLAPLLKILHDSFGVEQGFINTIHAYTSGCGLVDGPGASQREVRTAALNIIPFRSSAAAAVGKVLPELADRLSSMMMWAPVPVGSVLDLTVNLQKSVSKEEVNDAVRAAAETSMQGIVEFSYGARVSSDIRGSTYSAIFDPVFTMVLPDSLVKVILWFDNEFGYSTRVVDLAQKLI
ncbi:MAG: type I glyceraldehyde-3-phosphate dehydrogenase [Spirochaeta sp. LUC14_002_19_P3]|nr:MAG: type I glyceraldehyde-3-phosphate dehydrogenase [Spirochaeta sp. LUC14_002_19_P3]